MNKRLNIVKVGGQVVEDDASLNTLLGSFCSIEGSKILHRPENRMKKVR